MPSFRRRTIPSSAQMGADTKTFLAPVRGWIQSENLATSSPNGASILENFFPTTRGIRPRGGSLRHATIDDGVKSLMVWRSGGVETLFASDADSIYEITTPASPTVQPTADVTTLGGGNFSSVMFANAGGDFLIAVNGEDGVRSYDGAAWADQTSGITGTSGGVDDFSHVWVFKNRLFFIQKGTMNAWCLTVDAITGAATQISLSGVFQKGGQLLFGDTWSVDAGNGLNDICVFVSSAGEVVGFQGSDPSDPNDWSAIGRYDIGRPLGPNAKFRAGGDIIIATMDGLVPLSAALKKDPAALTLAAVTSNIETAWKIEALARQSSQAWSILKWTSRGMAIVGLPTVGTSEVCAFVVNLLTGAWAKYTAWDISCQAEVGNVAYFGTPGGGVFVSEASGADDGEPYSSTCVGLYDNLRQPASQKVVTMARSSWLYRKPFTAKISFSFDYIAKLPTYPSAAAHPSLDEWDVALWDVALWDSSTAEQIVTRWVSVSGQGFSVAPNVQITNSHASPPEAELVSIDLLYEEGGVAV